VGGRALKEDFERVRKLSPGKPAALAEVGFIPNPDQMKEEDAMWSWFMAWCGPFIMGDEWEGPPLPAPDPDSPPMPKEWSVNAEELKAIYTSEYAVTLEDLPWNAGKGE